MAISMFGGASAKKPETAGDLIKDTTTQAFVADVIEASRKVPVLVDFWAPWCGPCKQLTPVLEKVVRAAKGAVRLVKMDIDKYPEVAGQLGVQSIPAVFAFKDGQPVDGFMGALPESQVKAFVQRLIGPGDAAGGEMPGLEEAKAAFEAGDIGGAAGRFAAVLQGRPRERGRHRGPGEVLHRRRGFRPRGADAGAGSARQADGGGVCQRQGRAGACEEGGAGARY